MRNKPWFLVAKKEYLQRVRSRSYLAVTLAAPLLVGLIVAIPSRLSPVQEGRGYDIAVLDSTETVFEPLRVELEGGMRARSGMYHLLESPSDLRRADLLAWVRQGALDAMVVITGGGECATSAELVAGPRTDSLTISHFKTALSRAALKLRLRQEGMTQDHISELMRPLPVSVLRIRGSAGDRDPEAVFLVVLFMAMILYLTLLIYGMATMRSVVEEKSTRIVELLLASIRPTELLAGKILGVALVGLTQYLVWFTLSGFASSACSGGEGILAGHGTENGLREVWIGLLPAMVGFFVLGYLLYACLYATAGALAGQPSDTQHLQFPITLLLLVPIVILPLVINMPDAPLIRVLSLVPFFSPLLMFCRIAVSNIAAWETSLCVVLLVLAVGIAWWLSARIYRVTILMSGKHITLREVGRWIQYE